MKTQMIKRFTMLSLVSMFTVFAAVAAANAQLSNPITAKIPFDFSVGNKQLPAGEYGFTRQSGIGDNGLMSVRGVDNKTHLFQSTLNAQVNTPNDQSMLVFHKYGDQYFLEQIWSGGERQGTQLPESRKERTTRLKLAQTQQSNMTRKAIMCETVEVVAGLL
jgi:hypothetical protein